MCQNLLIKPTYPLFFLLKKKTLLLAAKCKLKNYLTLNERRTSWRNGVDWHILCGFLLLLLWLWFENIDLKKYINYNIYFLNFFHLFT